MDGWVLLTDHTPEEDEMVWLGNTSRVHFTPVPALSGGYRALLDDEEWTHWLHCYRPEPPRKPITAIACDAMSSARAAGWTHDQLVEAILAEIDRHEVGDGGA